MTTKELRERVREDRKLRAIFRQRIKNLEAENARLRARVVELEDYEAPVNLDNMNTKALRQEEKCSDPNCWVCVEIKQEVK